MGSTLKPSLDKILKSTKEFIPKVQALKAKREARDPNWYNSQQYKDAEAYKKEHAAYFDPTTDEYKRGAGGGVLDAGPFHKDFGKEFRDIHDTYNSMLKTAESMADQKARVRETEELILNPPTPDPEATRQEAGLDDELKRQKRLEGLRAGLLSTRKSLNNKSLGAQSLLTPAQSIYGSKLKSKLGA